VLVAGIGRVFVPSKLATSIDKAVIIAAQQALCDLGAHVDGMTLIIVVKGRLKVKFTNT